VPRARRTQRAGAAIWTTTTTQRWSSARNAQRASSTPTGRRSEATGHWKTLTFLGALRVDQFTAPCVFDGPINGQCFHAYVEQILIPVLKPGDIVILDNLGSHKAKAIRSTLRAVNARLWYLPKYSPDLIRSSRPSQRSNTG
jgi:DDE superfamily endonuclease